MSHDIHILGIAGSLRKGSYNRALLLAAQSLMPEGMTMEVADISQFPLFNEDVFNAGLPAPVEVFRNQIRSADGLLIATPEYNYSIPGVLKNAIDWASRPLQTQPFNDKPLAMMGAGGRMGTARAQAHLRQVAVFLNMHALNRPEVEVQLAREQFDAEGNLTNERYRQGIQDLLAALKEWILRLETSRETVIR